MLIKMFPAEQFDPTGVSNESSESKGIESGEGKKSPKGSNFCGVEGWEDMDIDQFGSGIGFFQAQDDLYLDVVSPPFQSCDDEIRKIFGIDFQNSELIEAKEKGSYVFPAASFEILRRYGNRRLRLDREKSNAGTQMKSTDSRSSMVSTEKIIELAAEKFIQSMSQSIEISRISHPYPSSVLGHSEDDSKGVQLVQNLLLCAEKVGDKKYECACKLLEECDKMSSSTGTPIQRLVYYFSEALYEKIDRETGTITAKGLGKKILDPLEAFKCTNTFLIASHEKLPLSQITKFSGIQAIVDCVAEASKVHVIDLMIRIGVQCTILM
ncbi:hypothetical protein Pfo_015883 [Paulownia fortunei]|nr:hypothetical protein Pfo_015883 [Paulownia fortunei]